MHLFRHFVAIHSTEKTGARRTTTRPPADTLDARATLATGRKFVVGRSGFEPLKLDATGLQPVPFGHLGTCPESQPATCFQRPTVHSTEIKRAEHARECVRLHRLHELAVGFEPTTPGLQNRSSAVELR